MAEYSGGGVESRLTKIEQIQAQLQDAMLVHATLEANSARRIKEHAQLIADNEESMMRHRLRMDRFDDKLNALIEMCSRQQGGMEGL